MFEALRWRNETALRHAVNSLAHAGRTPFVLGSIAAMAVVGVLTGMGLNHSGRGRKAKIIPARVRAAVENAVSSSSPHNGRRRRHRKTKVKTTTH